MIWSLVKPPAAAGRFPYRRLSACSTRAWTVTTDQEAYDLSSCERRDSRPPYPLFHRRCRAGSEERLMGSLAQEARAYGQVRGVMPLSCAYLAADASTRGRTSA
jgi:hypothetical protein